jgi:malate/lactate dehydrogenase
MKVGIARMGWVGSSVAISVLESGIASELLVCDVIGTGTMLDNVALSLPSIVSGCGATDVLEPDMTREERDALERSAEVLRQAQASVLAAAAP